MGWILFIIGVIGWHWGMYGLFKKVGIAPWKALVPFYNTWCIVQVSNIKRIWFWLQFIPIAGQFITIWITIIFTMNFARFSFIDHTGAALLPFIYFPYLANDKKVKWRGQEVIKLYEKSTAREWADAGVFAIVAATIIRTFVFEAYTIPTESMEKTLLVNDFLFVNKVAYGPRIPQTPLSFPFVHNTMPYAPTTASYVKWIQIPYTRVPGYEKVERNDVVVFNFPAGDTIINLPDYGSKRPYYDVLRFEFKGDRDALKAQFPLLVHPMDKTDNYIKRCVAVPNDILALKNGVLYINNQPAFAPPDAQIDYVVKTKGPFTDDFLVNTLGIDDVNDNNGQMEAFPGRTDMYRINMTPKEFAILKQQPNVDSADVLVENYVGMNFPNDDANMPFSLDNFGPITIPAKGATVNLSTKNIAIYRRIITNYEGNSLEESNGNFIINGKATPTYTFKYNYYWMMGDNRHRSQDSRYWGFVPETHIVGKASLIWMSYGKSGIRTSRIMQLIK